MEVEVLKFLTEHFGIIGTIILVLILGTFYTISHLIKTLRSSVIQNSNHDLSNDDLEKKRIEVNERIIVMTGELISTNGQQTRYMGELVKTQEEHIKALVNINKAMESSANKTDEQLQISKEMLLLQREQAEALKGIPSMLQQTEKKLLDSQTATTHSLQSLLKELSAKLFTTAQDMNVAAEKINDSQDLKGVYDQLAAEGKLPARE